ncbi:MULTISPECIES: class I SAM-dependent methyltransferase [unclassified Nostoc]|uniref:class I SAM-dependent methyltransferase n=1 Tax=unclassified Nostoc TaxID=2593658 RepID=UPI0026086E44|nr:class I SAM-dependent methyltransferase [Nostoc sp. S13]MDF5735821.1 class I SAM-dependent methyltransferase [Nostoc sp. S13]
MKYEAVNESVISYIPNTAQRILDIGCGTGDLGRTIKSKINCEIIGITYSQLEANHAASYLNQVLVRDLNSFEPYKLGKFDCIICSHILEHLYQPEELLTKLHECLYPHGVLIIALPNTLHYKQRLEFLKGNFKYTDGGLMDKTHFRFFDWDTAFDLVNNSGFQIILRYADGYLPMPLIRKFTFINPLVSHLDKLASAVMPELFGVQFIIVAKSS